MEPRQEFRIPTLLAVLVVGSIAAIISVFSNNARLLLGRALNTPDVIPEAVEITSVNDTQALLYWKSRRPVGSSLLVKSIDGWRTVYDVRDTDNAPKQYTLHIFLVTGLPPADSSPFEIKIGSQTVYRNTIVTGPTLLNKPQTLPLYGDSFSEGTSLVRATIGNSASWTTVVDGSSRWALPLSTLRTGDLTEYYCTISSCADTIIVTLEFITDTSSTKKVIPVKQAQPYTKNDESNTRRMAQIKSTPSTTPVPEKVLAAVSIVQPLSILSPSENAALSFAKPLIRGEGSPNNEVIITLRGTITQIGKTSVNQKGIWQWTPKYPLDSGLYHLSVSEGSAHANRTFTILQSGKKVLSASTPSATLIPVVPNTYEEPIPTPTMFVTAGPALSIFFIGGGSLLLLLSLSLL